MGDLSVVDLILFVLAPFAASFVAGLAFRRIGGIGLLASEGPLFDPERPLASADADGSSCP